MCTVKSLINVVFVSFIIISLVQAYPATAQEEVNGNYSYVLGTEAVREYKSTNYLEPIYFFCGDAFIFDIGYMLRNNGKGRLDGETYAYYVILEHADDPEGGYPLYNEALNTIVNTPGGDILIYYGHSDDEYLMLYSKDPEQSSYLGRLMPKNWVEQVDYVAIWAGTVGYYMRQRPLNQLPGLVILESCHSAETQHTYNWRWAFRFLDQDSPNYWYSRGFVGYLSRSIFCGTGEYYIRNLIHQLMDYSNVGLIDSARNAYYELSKEQREYLHVIIKTFNYETELGDDNAYETLLVLGDPYLHIDPPVDIDKLLINNTLNMLKRDLPEIYSYIVENDVTPFIKVKDEQWCSCIPPVNNNCIRLYDKYIIKWESDGFEVEAYYIVRNGYYSLDLLYVYTRLPELLNKLYARNGEYYISLINRYVNDSIEELRRKSIPVEAKAIVDNASSGYYNYFVKYAFELYGKPLYYAEFNNILAPAIPRSRGYYYFSFRKDKSSFGFSYYNGISLLQVIAKDPSNKVTLINSSIDTNIAVEKINGTLNKLLREDGLSEKKIDVEKKIYDGFFIIYDSDKSLLTIKPGYLAVYRITPCDCNKLYEYWIAYFYGVEEPIYTKCLYYTQCIPSCRLPFRNISNTVENDEYDSGSKTLINEDESVTSTTRTTTSTTNTNTNATIGKDSREIEENKTSITDYLATLVILVLLIISIIAFIKYR